MNLLLPGAYVAADSALHRLDPRVKMGAALLLMALPFAAPGLESSLLLLVFVAFIIYVSTAPLPAVLRTLHTIVWVGFFMFFFYLFTTPGRSLVAWGGIAITWEGILAGVRQIYRLCLLVIIAALLTFTTSPSQLAHGLEALLGPLARLGLPVRELAMVLTIALRFVPTLSDEVDKIIKAQRSRGLDSVSMNPFHRVRSWVPAFVPIFVSAFRRAEDLAVAMEARGFRGAVYRTRLYRLRLTRRDLAAALIVLAFTLVVAGVDRLM
jgi:energy-coupling factor transport system permease protein